MSNAETYGDGLAAGLFIGLLVLTTVLGYLAVTGYSLTPCAEEDSCRADYDGNAGAWRIIPIENN